MKCWMIAVPEVLGWLPTCSVSYRSLNCSLPSGVKLNTVLMARPNGLAIYRLAVQVIYYDVVS